MFKRWIEIPEHRSCLLTGPRRCGKTTLLKLRYPGLPYATLDDLDFLAWAKQDPKQFTVRKERPVKRFLFYPGEEYQTVDGVRMIPIAALYRGG